MLHDGTTVQACNQAAAELFGYSRDELLGMSLVALIAKSSRTEVSQRMGDADTGAYVALGLHADGSEMPMRVHGRALNDELRMVTLCPVQAEEDDLAELREALEQKDEVLRLKETSRFKTQILNTTAHELNTPLTPVRLQLHLLKTGALGQLNERHGKAIGIIDRNIERLSFLVNDILDVARLESGRIDIKRSPVDLAPIIDEALESFYETARRVGVELRLERGVGLVLDADKDRINQVIFNILGNALKFTPEGGEVVVRCLEADGAARIEVQDTGPGLDQEQIERLFEPFSRVHDTTHSTIAGTGLGLYICKGLVEAHGGHIEALSPGPGKGATFAINIPLSQDAVPVPQPETPRKKGLDPLAQRLRELI